MSEISKVDVIIIGAGAAGLMCAIEAGKRGRRVLVLDKARKLAPKILISGGGRCNFTNLSIDPGAYLSNNPHFCKSALARYTQWDFLGLMEKHGLSWQEKTLGQLFCDQKAPAVVAMLARECRDGGVRIELETGVERVEREDGFKVSTGEGNYRCESLVIATGGPSVPRMGSTDFGLQLARQFGLKTVPFRPGLVPLVFGREVMERYFSGLSGLSLEVVASCGDTSFREQLLVTHRGLSGPAILQISSYWREGRQIELNLLPDLDAADWLIERRERRGSTRLASLLSEKLPRRLARRLAKVLPARPMAELRLGEISSRELQELGARLNGWALQPAGTEGMRTAEVSLGGVETAELSSKTMVASKVPGLYYIGEAVDVTGWLGGYNFQWAWSSGWVAGQAV